MSSIMERITQWIDGTSSLTRLAILDFGIQWILWGIASIMKTEKFYDLAGMFEFVYDSFFIFHSACE